MLKAILEVLMISPPFPPYKTNDYQTSKSIVVKQVNQNTLAKPNMKQQYNTQPPPHRRQRI